MRSKNYKIFDNYYTNEPGVWNFIPNNVDSYKKKKPCFGFGQIKYQEGSIYTGQIYFDGKYYHKQGYGQQDFTYSTLGKIETEINEKKYLFVGYFDYKKTNWIHGNGVLYYRDVEGKPSRFVKGFFSNLSKIDEYQGEFDYSTLINGYSKEMESNYTSKLILIKKELDLLNYIEQPDTLFVGDSYFEFWHYKDYTNHLFNDSFNYKNHLNIGVGGSKFTDWIDFAKELKDFPKFKNIVVNLGFNDLHHSRINTPTKIYNDFLKFLNVFREIFPDAKYYFLSVCHSPAYNFLKRKEVVFNNKMKNNSKINNITIIDNSNAIYEKNLNYNCYSSDLVHLNNTGYEIMCNEIKKYIK